MILRNQVEWALHCCTALALFESESRISTKSLAEFHGVPKEYLSKALQALSQADLIDSTLGPTGGYRLKKPADQITFLDVVEAIEGKRNTFQCTEIRANNPCIPKKTKFPTKCEIAHIMHKADDAWRESLKKTTIADLAKELKNKLPEKLLKENETWLHSRT